MPPNASVSASAMLCLNSVNVEPPNMAAISRPSFFNAKRHWTSWPMGSFAQCNARAWIARSYLRSSNSSNSESVEILAFGNSALQKSGNPATRKTSRKSRLMSLILSLHSVAAISCRNIVRRDPRSARRRRSSSVLRSQIKFDSLSLCFLSEMESLVRAVIRRRYPKLKSPSPERLTGRYRIR